jgi:hypothetical protein
MFIKLFRYTLIAIFFSNQVFAADIKIVGVIDVKNPTKKSANHSLAYKAPAPKISLLKIDLTNRAQQTIANRLEKTQVTSYLKNTPSSLYPKEVALGMQDVPVLNQGMHGSCVVFAVSAAVDAIIGKGDYVSQLCQLGLGRYLENNGYSSSGWDGAWARTILSQMDLFGFASKESQRANSCAGLSEYPICGPDVIEEESIVDFHKISENLPSNKTAWSSIIDVYQVSSDKIDEERIFLEVKKSLYAGDRVVIGVLLLDFDQGIVGAVGSYKGKFDSWVITPEIANDINDQTEFGGHAMVITGYDDNAVATDAEGRTYRGLFTLRNSWGEKIGDQGNFYMSYDYFKSLMLEAQRIRHL